MATDIKRIISNLLEFYEFSNQTIISVGAGGGQFVEYGRTAKSVIAIDSDSEALARLSESLTKANLAEKFTLIHSDFYQVNLKADVVIFEFCLHEMSDPAKAIRHAQSMAPTVLITDHGTDSEWAYIVDEREKVANSWAAVNQFPAKSIRQYGAIQAFHDYNELYNRVSIQGENTISRIAKFKEQQDITIPMTYAFAQL